MKQYINTAQGRAYYVTTEVENEYGSWNDSYETVAGYWVIHEGNKHHVYKTNKNRFTPSSSKIRMQEKYHSSRSNMITFRVVRTNGEILYPTYDTDGDFADDAGLTEVEKNMIIRRVHG